MIRHTIQHRALAFAEVRGTRDPGLPLMGAPPRLDPAYRQREEHDYTYGLSNPALRPRVDDERYSILAAARVKKRDTRIPSAPKPVVPRHRRIQSEVAAVTAASVPWWMDEEVLVSRNEAMIADLLGDECCDTPCVSGNGAS